MPTQSQKKHDPRTAFNTAKAFQNNAAVYIEYLGKDINTAAQRAMNDFGGLIASATSLALALELYLKSLRLLIGMPILQRHELWALYKTIHPDIRNSIERHYEATRTPINSSDAVSVVMAIAPKQAPISDIKLAREQSKLTAKDKSIQEVLRRNNDAFRTWRYLHEAGDPSKIEMYEYEFHHMNVIANTLHLHISNAIQQKKVVLYNPEQSQTNVAQPE